MTTPNKFNEFKHAEDPVQRLQGWRLKRPGSVVAEREDERAALWNWPGTERAVTSRDSIRFGDTVIEYEVRRSVRRKRTVQITLDGGAVRVAAPSTTPKREIQEFVEKKAPWIIGHMATAAVEAAPKRLVSGETLPYLGRDVRMVVEFAYMGRPEVRFRSPASPGRRARRP